MLLISGNSNIYFKKLNVKVTHDKLVCKRQTKIKRKGEGL